MSNSNLSDSAADNRERLARLLRARTGGEAAAGVSAASMLPRHPRGSAVPASHAQRRLWFFDQLTPGTGIYNIHAGLKITGPLDIDRLRAALTGIVARHEVLRTRFIDVDGEPMQVIDAAAQVDLPLEVLAGSSATQREDEARRRANDEASAPFDLSSGRLFRARLLRLAPDVQVLLMTMHHIASDGASITLLMRELRALYAGEQLPPLPVQYADFAAWQRQQANSDPAYEQQLAFWRDHLANVPVVELPTDRPRPAAQSFRGRTHVAVLDLQLIDGVKQVARRHGTTLFTVMLAAFHVLLARLSGQCDVTIGTPVSGRSRPELELLLGCFINTLPIRVDLGGSPSFDEVVGRTRAATLAAFANQDVSFDKIVEALNPPRDRGRTPFFQILFNMLGADSTWRLPFGPATADLMPPTDEPSKFDLTVYVGETTDSWYLRTVYNADLFSDARIDTFIDQYRLLLIGIAADSTQPIDGYSLVTAAAPLPDPAQPLTSMWAGSVIQRLEEVAAREPERLAIQCGADRWSYARLSTQIDRVAARLRDAGVGTEHVVAVYAKRTPHLVTTLLGIWKAGAAFCVLDARYPVARLAECMRIARPRALVAIEADAPGELTALVPASASFVADGLDDGVMSLPQRTEPDAMAYVAFTSGSTGTPKGIVGTHRPVAHFIDWHVRTFAFSDADRFSMLSGLAHDPLLRDILTPLWIGASLHIPSERDLDTGEGLLDWVCRSGITVAHLTPPMAQLMAQSNGIGRGSALRWAFFGGDRLTAEHVAALRALAPRVKCVNFYGATETPQAMGVFDPAQHGEAPASGAWPIGTSIDGVQLLVLNGAGRLAGVGEVGEICVRTPYLTRGYFDGDERGAFSGNHDTDRMYYTRDLGRYRPDGLIDLVGRRDTQVKIRGFRVELGDVETVLAAHPAVDQAVVAFDADDPRGPRLVAYVVAGRACDAPALRAYMMARVPEYMVPAVFVPLAALPLTPNGKIDRARLPRAAVAAGASAHVPPATPIEELLAEIWADLLGREQIGTTDNFFELGGHSLLATQVVSRVRAAFDIDLPLRRVFDVPTIGGLAVIVTEALLNDDHLEASAGIAGASGVNER